jgi:ABC-2 type transport system ATP-binding protein
MERKSVRDLVTKLRAEGKTIFLNSHLLSEVEMVCDRIVILDKGRVACAATPQEFTRGTGEYLIRVAAVTEEVRVAVATITQNGNASSSSNNAPIWQDAMLRFKPRDRTQLNAVLDRLRSLSVEIESVEPVKLSLEEFFIQVVAGSES